MTMNAQELFDLITSKGYSIIEEFVSENKPENIILDFKEKSNPDGSRLMGQDDKHNYAKALSGFANSSGGVLVWGVGEKEIDNSIIAYCKKPISNLSRFIQNLESLLPEAVVPNVEGVQSEAVKISEREDKGYAVTLVPESPKPPHRAEFKLHQYYKRSGDSFRAMEHSDIDDMFGRRARPELTLDIEYTTIDVSQRELHKYKLNVSLRNEGRGIAKYYGFDMQFPKSAIKRPEIGDAISHSRVQVYEEGKEGLVTLKYRSKDSDSPIFPNEVIKIVPNNYYGGHVNYCVDQEVWDKFNDKDLRITIYCENANTKDIIIPFSNLNKF